MDLQLANQTAVVSGSTGGIGLEIARSLAIEGADVVVSGRSGPKVDAAIASIKESGGASVRGVVADVTTEAGATALLEAAGTVDILVNNLGIYESKAFADIADEDWIRFFDVNVVSGVRLARAVFPGMLERNYGRIIFVSSESALSIPKDMIHYAVTKTAQLTIARGLAELTKGTRVTVNSVLPGPTRSEGVEDFLKSVASSPDAPASEIEAEFFAKSRAASLLQRMIEPGEIASLVTYLASPLASATNGAAVRVEGGLVATIA
ncbi:SDR family oxidoreductase [Rhizobiaceae bacterium n13]|uniref:SDR family oxidoreductase n=1 Tax=Ferirhizobium litorale TaxID=2927786 RepID=A0AAE3U2H4_9HYPH|nr:SDR family oxidoreductase [Fererhizobium litorale]MDI7861226.1 SDR family oxidoreductase [Fererhizobium litorale]MDI7921373.1 SDR family oxidoreductase [Fererhizobium litorale]